MEILYDKSFFKSLDKLKEKHLKLEVLAFIESIKNAKTLSEIPNIKKLKGYKDCYRLNFLPTGLVFKQEAIKLS